MAVNPYFTISGHYNGQRLSSYYSLQEVTDHKREDLAIKINIYKFCIRKFKKNIIRTFHIR